MTFDQLAGLIKAGYTEEQIRNISSIMGAGTNTGTNTGTGTGTGTQTLTPTTTETPTTGGTLPSAAKPTPTDPPTPTNPPEPKESETVSLLKEMLGIIQKGNIAGMSGNIPEPETGADVLAEILNPTPRTA